MPSAVTIFALHERPDLRATVADRIWNAWWREEGVSLDAVAQRVAESLSTALLPTTLVALAGEAFAGTGSVIASDMEERPQYTPWLAALWVEPSMRGKGIGAALVRAAGDAARGAGHEVLYLAATPGNAGYYMPLGWRVLEEGVAGLAVMQRELASSAASV